MTDERTISMSDPQRRPDTEHAGAPANAAPVRPRLRSLTPETDDRHLHTATPADEAELRAATLYESGYWCGEAVLKTVNEIAGHRMPPEVVKMASGFCEGFGGSRCTCGALAGAVMAAGMFVGREGPDEPWEPVYDAAAELRRRFVLSECATTCDEVVRRVGGMHRPERWTHCAALVGQCARWTIEIADEQGWL